VVKGPSHSLYELQLENSWYGQIKETLEDDIPDWYGIFKAPNGEAFAVMSDVGQSLPQDLHERDASPHVGQTLREELDKLLSMDEKFQLMAIVHKLKEAKVHHEDLRPDNIVRGEDGKIRLIDLHLMETCLCKDHPCEEQSRFKNELSFV